MKEKIDRILEQAKSFAHNAIDFCRSNLSLVGIVLGVVLLISLCVFPATCNNDAPREVNAESFTESDKYEDSIRSASCGGYSIAIPFLLIVFIATFAFIFYLGIRDGVRKGLEKKTPLLTKEQIHLDIIKAMCQDFRKLGWTNWNDAVHYEYGQFERIRSAATDHRLSFISYDKESGEGLVRGTTNNLYFVSKNRCECKDFQARQKPCKHMYLLAMNIADNS